MKSRLAAWALKACLTTGRAACRALLLMATGLAQAQPVTTQVLYTTQYEGRYTMQYLRLQKGTAQPTYAIWFPPMARAGEAQHQGGAVLLTNPYAGIDWTSEPQDVWAFAQTGQRDIFTLIPDVYGPAYDPDNQTFVSYDYSDYHDAGAFALPFVMNGLGAMIVFERFYAGGSLQQNIDSTLIGLEFIQAQPDIKMSKVAVWGASWGGTLSAYAAAQAPAPLKPALGVAITPILDFEKFVSYGRVLPSLVNDAFQATYRLEPYVRRAQASAEKDGSVDYTPYTVDTLSAGIEMPFLFLHDTLDSIAPFVHAVPLYYSEKPGLEVMLYPHLDNSTDWRDFDIGHAPVRPGYDESSALLFSYTYLLDRLSTVNDWILVPLMPDLDPDGFFQYMHTQHTLGFDTRRHLVPRLLDLCDSRVFLVRYDDGFSTPTWGRTFVAEMLRKHWGLSVTEDDVVTRLAELGR